MTWHQLPAAALAAAFLAFSGPVAAETADDLPDWVPEPGVLPEEFTIIRESAVGSTVRLLVIELSDDEDLIAEWQEALETAGYQVETPETELEQSRIIFSGEGIRTGQIVTLPGTPQGAALIQIDATLE